MYVLARHEGESILMFDGLVEIKVLQVTGKIARLGIEAPKEIDIIRAELAEDRENSDGLA
jgi:carbon storage regulator CsrA